jgi:hypothetical protein
MIAPVKHLNFVHCDETNRMSVTSAAGTAEFDLTDEQVILLWEQLGDRLAKLARMALG